MTDYRTVPPRPSREEIAALFAGRRLDEHPSPSREMMSYWAGALKRADTILAMFPARDHMEKTDGQ
jgi:hypothetical protein